MSRVVKVQPVPPATLRVTLQDRREAEIDIKELLGLEAFAPLLDPEYFGKAEVDEIGGICWPNGADLSPEWIAEATEAALTPRR